MQTFAIYEDDPIRLLDTKRLFNQMNEHKVIWAAVADGAKPWSSHPACTMWRGYLGGLAWYGVQVAEELQHRARLTQLSHYRVLLSYADPSNLPAWWGYEAFHEAHRSNLTRKDPVFYRTRFMADPGDTYVWPKQRSDGTWDMRRKVVGARTYATSLGVIPGTMRDHQYVHA